MIIRKEKIAFFERHLMDFFRKAGREHLPWRLPRGGALRGKNKVAAYEVWVSEIMLQQTQVSRVIGYYTRFLKRFPNVGSLAKADWKEFLPYYEGLGYYARGRNMLRAARMIVQEYGGKFPRDKKVLGTLPGIGPYTAAAIMSFAYGDEHLAWDTNLSRVIGRFFYGGKHLVTDTTLWEQAFETPKKMLNAALMDFGSALCVARPKCEACALRKRCVYYREKGRSEQPTASRQPAYRTGRQSTKNKAQKTRGKKQNWQEAQAYVFLHENHKKYFSSDKRTFKPFILPSGYNTRAGIKQYFREKYALSLSVRPPYRKALIDGRPTLFVNAQILLGEPAFRVFLKKDAKQYTEKVG
ncbi:MAG: hypothetical protein AAB547_01960 [Patescibacteria group bacterium]